MKDGISIVICTYNGADLLPATSRHISRQQVSADLSWEVVIVDNASTDHSAEVARSEWATHLCPAPLRVLHQPRPGLTLAREMGFTAAHYKYIVMCDDDNWLASNYITTSCHIMELHPAIGMLGGQGEYDYEACPPDWVVAYPIHAGGPQAPATGIAPAHGLYGAGSVMRKAAYLTIRQAGFSFLLTDRLGCQLSSGGDFELCYGLAMANYLIWYDQRLRFTHHIPKERVTWAYYVKYLNEDASSFRVLEPYQILLDAKADSLFTFGVILAKNCLLYTVHLLHNVLIKQRKSLMETDRKLIALKIIGLKARVYSYKHWVEMGQNFLIARKFRQRYTAQLTTGRRTDRAVTLSSELEK